MNLIIIEGLGSDRTDLSKVTKGKGKENQKEQEGKREIILDPYQETKKQEMIRYLSEGGANVALEILEKHLLEEIIKSPEILEAAKKGIIKRLYWGDVNNAIEIIKGLNIPKAIINSQEIQEAAISGVNVCIRWKWFDDIRKITKEFNIPWEKIQEIIIEETIKRLLNREVNNAREIVKEFNISEGEIVKVFQERLQPLFQQKE